MIVEPETISTAEAPYATSDEHLWDELRRVEYLVRAQVVRWRRQIADQKPEHLWGMVHVTHAEVDALLDAPPHVPDEPLEALDPALDAFWQQAEEAATAIDRRLELTPTPIRQRLRLPRLCALFGLGELERDILLVCLLPELDARYRRLYGYLMDDASRSRPTVELALQILRRERAAPEAGAPWLPRDPLEGRAAFAAGAPLLANHLLQLTGDAAGDDPLPARSIRLDDRVAAFLLGGDSPDDRLAGVLARAEAGLGWDELIVSEQLLGALQTLASRWEDLRADPAAGLVLYFHGPDGVGRLGAARAICHAAGTPLLVADAAAALRAPCGFEQAVELAYREAQLRGAALYWAGCDLLLEREQPVQRWDHLVAAAARFDGLTVLAGQVAWDPSGQTRDPRRPFIRLNFSLPDYRLRLRLWQRWLGAADTPERHVTIELLASSFQLTKGQILDAIETARGLAALREPGGQPPTAEELYEGCRRQSSKRLITMARLIRPRPGLSAGDLIVSEPSRRQLDELRARMRYRHQLYGELGFERRLSLGKGLIALFTGSSGTGKTMAAELLAHEQGVDLYKVDLSRVVSKWVGETEKNLGQVFAEAEDANAVLFFDEADALFGKRGEVKEAHDRWANMETNFLLQRIEEYSGVVILASNLRQNIDEAFLRRIHVVVEFLFPDEQCRRRIWEGLFPPGLAIDPEVDFGLLARQFSIAGGSIRNIAVDAAFRALAEAQGQAPRLRLRHLALGTAREYQKLGRPITRGEFGDTFYQWVAQSILLAPVERRLSYGQDKD